MIKINIEIDPSNDAFDDFHGAEIRRVIRNVADRIGLQVTDSREVEPGEASIMDVNGNSIGRWTVSVEK